MPLLAILTADCIAALGTDGASTNDALDMHETKVLSLLPKTTSCTLRREYWPTADDALTMATTGGAVALRVAGSLGHIATGYHADLVFDRGNGAALAPANEHMQKRVFAKRGHSVTRVLVAGRNTHEDGHWPGLDVEGALAAARNMHSRQQP